MQRKAALVLVFVSAAALAQGSPSFLDRHCAAQPADAAKRQDLVGQLKARIASGTADERSQAADTLSCYGEASRGAVPDMIRLFVEPQGEIQANAVAALARLGPVAVPALTEALDSSQPNVRSNAARALGRIGPAAGAALPKLRELAAAGDPAYSFLAEIAIRRIEARKE